MKNPYEQFGVEEQGNPYSNFGWEGEEKDSAPNPYSEFEDIGAVKGLVNTARRAGHSALSTVNVASAVGAGGRRDDYLTDAERLEKQADTIDQLQPSWSPENRAAWAERARKTARGLRERAEGMQGSVKNALTRAAESNAAAEKIPVSDDYQKYQDAKGGQAFVEFLKNPVEVPLNIATEGMVGSAPALALAALGSGAGPAGTALGAGMGSFGSEYASTWLDVARDRKIDIRDGDALMSAFADPEVQAEARKRGVARGIPVAVFDALSAGIGGRLAAPAAKQGVKKLVKSVGKELAEQAGLGMAGEAAGQVSEQLATKGRVDDLSVKDIVAEGIGELVPGLGEVTLGATRRLAADTGRNTPESVDTLKRQQAALVEGRQEVQMFPKGTKELPLPEGFGRVETDRGIFHFNPEKIDAGTIVEASKSGRENEILGLGPASKADIDARAATGEPVTAVVEQAPNGTEIKAALATPTTLKETASEMTARKAPDSKIVTKSPQSVVESRGGVVGDLLQADKQQQSQRAEAEARERAEREARQQELAQKRGRFDETMQAAVKLAKDPQRSFAAVQGALESAKFYADDNSLGLSQEQREIALRAVKVLQNMANQMAPAENARREKLAAARANLEAQQAAVQQAKIAADKKSVAAAEAAGIGASGGIDYARLSEQQLAQRAQAGDRRAEREMDRRVMVGDEPSTAESLIDVLAELKLPATDPKFGGELAQLKEEMKPAQRMRFIDTQRGSLDRLAETLRDRGFSQIQTPDDVIKWAGIALRGKPVWSQGGSPQQVDFAAGSQQQGAAPSPAPAPAPVNLQREQGLLQAAASELSKHYDLVIGEISRELRSRGYQGEIPEGAEAAVGHGAIVIDSGAYRNRETGVARLAHEVAHLYLNALPKQTVDTLKAMHRAEVMHKTGPLFDQHRNLRTDLRFVTDLNERGFGEWFAERVRLINQQWAEGRVNRAEKPLLVRLAADIRDMLRRVFARISRRQGISPESALFEQGFRKFWQSGGTYSPNREAVAFASQPAPAPKPERTFQITPELAAKQVAVVALPERPASGRNPSEVRAAVIEAMRDKFNVPVKNEDTGAQIAFNKASLAHGFQHMGPQNVYAALALPELLRSAVHIAKEADKRNRPQVRAVHRFAAALSIGPRIYRVKLTVNELPDGRLLYDHSATEIDAPGGTNLRGRTGEDSALVHRPAPGAIITLGDLFGGVKPGAQVQFAARKNKKPPGGSLPAGLNEQARNGPSPGESYGRLGAEFDAAVAEADRARTELESLRESQEPDVEEQGKRLQQTLRNAERRAKQLAKQMDALRAAEAPKTKIPNAAEIIAASAKVEALPQVDRKAALVEELNKAETSGRQMRAKDSLQSEVDAAWHEKRAAQLRQTLDREFPGWNESGHATPPGKPPVPPIVTEGANPEDSEPSPFAQPDVPMPVRPALARKVMFQTAVTPSAIHGAWEKVRNVLTGIRGPLPELPTFPAAAWNATDRFIRQFGASFYNRAKEGYRAFKSIGDHVQKTAEMKVAAITKKLLEVEKFDANKYARAQKIQESIRKARAEGRTPSAQQLATFEALASEAESHPYVLFQNLVLFLDLNWRQQNLKDSEGKPIRLPYNLNPAEVEAELDRLSGMLEASPHRDLIASALKQHMALVKEVADDLKSRDLMAGDELANPFYFPHVTLEARKGDKIVQRELRIEKVRPSTEADFRGYLIDPVGSDKPIETDYVRAMYYHLVQVGAHNARADIVRKNFRVYDVRAEVEKRARELSKERGYSVSWEAAFHEEYGPNGYVLYGTDSQDAFPTVTVDRERLAQRLGVMLTSEDLQKQLHDLGLRGIRLLPEDLKETMQLGGKEVWILPAKVAEALRGISEREDLRNGALDVAVKAALGYWKKWKLFTPHNHIRYEYGNISADLEKIFSADPATFKQFIPSARELVAFWKGAAPGPDLQAALKEGVLNAITAQEMKALPQMPNFAEFETRGKKAWNEFKAGVSAPMMNLTRLFMDGGVAGRVTSVEQSALREAITRYAKFKADLERIRSGSRPEYAGAYWRDVEAIQDSEPGANDADVRKAAAISKATFGDYADISVLGSTLRDKFIPFYSWLEVNFKYHANLLRNLRDMTIAGEKSRAEALEAGTRAAAVFASGFTARAAGAIVLRLALPYIAVAIWNNSMHKDVEDELSEEDKRRFHLILGRDSEGKAQVMYAPLALMDVMKWFSGPEFVRVSTAWMRGQMDFPTAVATWRDRLLPDLANNTFGQAGPLVQIPAALFFKKRIFPDVTQPGKIPAYDMRRTILSMLTDEFTADVVERTVNRDYYAPKDFGTWAQQLILQVRQRDAESWAYYSIRDKAADFLEAKTGDSAARTDRDKKNEEVLRNFRKAVYRGDVEAAMHFYKRALDYGYTSENFASSVRGQDPLGALKKKDGLRREFVQSLSEFDREQLRKAFIYYDKMNSIRGREKLLFPSERWGKAGLRSYQERPRFKYLQGLFEASQQQSEEERRRRADRALQQSLAPSRR